MKFSRFPLVLAVISISAIPLPAWSRISLGAARSLDSLDSSDEGSLERQIVAKEREELDALKTGSVGRFADLLSDGAVFVGAWGPASKAQVVKNVEGFTLSDYSTEDIRYVPLSPQSVSSRTGFTKRAFPMAGPWRPNHTFPRCA